MKKIMVFLMFLSVLLLMSCDKFADKCTGDSYKEYNDSDMTGLFAPSPKSGSLLSEEEFLLKVKSSPDIQYGGVIQYSKFVELFGKPQREVLLKLSEVGHEQTEPMPRTRYFEWALKNNKTIVYTIILSDDCTDEKANSNNIMEYGLVLTHVLPPSVTDD